MTANTEHMTHNDHTHDHGPDCGHPAREHDGHIDYIHEGHAHREHDGHYDECNTCGCDNCACETCDECKCADCQCVTCVHAA